MNSTFLIKVILFTSLECELLLYDKFFTIWVSFFGNIAPNIHSQELSRNQSYIYFRLLTNTEIDRLFNYKGCHLQNEKKNAYHYLLHGGQNDTLFEPNLHLHFCFSDMRGIHLLIIHNAWWWLLQMQLGSQTNKSVITRL